MEKIFALTVQEYREKISIDDRLQGIMHRYLLTACAQKNNGIGLNLKTACYAVAFVLNGRLGFETGLKQKIQQSVMNKDLDKTFLVGNYIQVAEKYWNAKDKNNDYRNLLFGDLVTNEGRRGSRAVYTGKASSNLMKAYIGENIAEYTIEDLFIELNLKVNKSIVISEHRRQQMARELRYAKNLMKTFDSETVELQQSKEDFREEENIRKNCTGSERETLILARRGQGQFRAGVLQINDKCPFTLIEDNELLIASHIKPWKYSDDKEKVDPNNGFVFTPTYDKLFDKGLITFLDDGTLLVSKELGDEVVKKLNLRPGEVLKDIHITQACKRFLAYHRMLVFRDNKRSKGKEYIIKQA